MIHAEWARLPTNYWLISPVQEMSNVYLDLEDWVLKRAKERRTVFVMASLKTETCPWPDLAPYHSVLPSLLLYKGGELLKSYFNNAY